MTDIAPHNTKWRIEYYPKRRTLKVGGGGAHRQRIIKCKLVVKYERKEAHEE